MMILVPSGKAQQSGKDYANLPKCVFLASSPYFDRDGPKPVPQHIDALGRDLKALKRWLNFSQV